MILDLVYMSKDFYIFNQVKSIFMYLLLGLSIINLYIRDFCHLVNALTPTDCDI